MAYEPGRLFGTELDQIMEGLSDKKGKSLPQQSFRGWGKSYHFCKTSWGTPSFSAFEPYTKFLQDRVLLKFLSTFIPKVPLFSNINQVISLPVLAPLPSSEERGLHTLDFSRCLRIYLERSKHHVGFRCAKLLLQYGAHVNSLSEDEELTPLHVAAGHGLPDHVALYLRHGAAVDKRDVRGETPLSAACSHPQSAEQLDSFCRVCARLIEGGADIHTRDRDQQSPLHLACKSANPQTVQLLLERGSAVNAMSYSGNTAMQNVLQVTAYKLQNQPEHIVRALLNHGAIRVWPGSLRKVLRHCCSSPRTLEVLLNTYSKLRGTDDWAEDVPEEELQKNPVFFQSVFSLSRSPRSLQHLCRCSLRSHLEGRLPDTLPKLPLPPPLLQFVQLGFEGVLY
ncbi:ankyrin repeat and SOCS box protein 10-like [Bufo bufo]|uniref:ankyrin repeat and SOCS box protein 10-like n=1 Tax=Bufo bufo TaxID=8384 RepID=UPI001ABE9E88|nr:ankyrin repeat and SOCS box protein 10-like [Bufo bufo]